MIACIGRRAIEAESPGWPGVASRLPVRSSLRPETDFHCGIRVASHLEMESIGFGQRYSFVLERDG